MFSRLVVVRRRAVRVMNIIVSVDVERNIFQAAGDVGEGVASPAERAFHRGYVAQKFACFVDQNCAGGHIILHHNFLHITRIVDRKFDGLGHEIAVRRDFLAQDIGFSRLQPFDKMRFPGNGSPLVNGLARFIRQRQPRAAQFHTGGSVCLGDQQFRRRVLYGFHKGNERNVLSLPGSVHFNDRVGFHITSRRGQFIDQIASQRKVNIEGQRAGFAGCA